MRALAGEDSESSIVTKREVKTGRDVIGEIVYPFLLSTFVQIIIKFLLPAKSRLIFNYL